jgi:hypothetical protein
VLRFLNWQASPHAFSGASRMLGGIIPAVTSLLVEATHGPGLLTGTDS